MLHRLMSLVAAVSLFTLLLGDTTAGQVMATPASQSTIMPFLTSPVEGDYNARINSWFDHDRRVNGYLTHYSGEQRAITDPIILGYNSYDGHDAIDYETGTGDPIFAAAGGTVIYADQATVDCSRFGLGTRESISVTIRHPNGAKTSYLHLSALRVSTGQEVTRRQVIGLSGESGCAFGDHLHFAVEVDGKVTDPFGWQGSYAEPCVASGSCAPSTWLWTEAAPDTTPPILTSTISGPAGANGWHIGSVMVAWQVEDPESGIASATGCESTSLSAETAGTTLTCTARNGAGLETTQPVTLKIDYTAPTFSGFPSVAAVDALSGVASVEQSLDGGLSWQPYGGSLAATPTMLLRACDNAGNCAALAAQLRASASDEWRLVTQGPLGQIRVLKQDYAGAAGVLTRDATVAIPGPGLYTIEGTVLAADPGIQTELRVDWLDAQGRAIMLDARGRPLGGMYIKSEPGATGRLIHPVLAPAGAAFGRFMVRSSGVGVIWIDDLALRGASGQNLLPDGGFDAPLAESWLARRWREGIGDISVEPFAGNPALRIGLQPTWTSDASRLIRTMRGGQTTSTLRGNAAFQVSAGTRYDLAVGAQFVDAERLTLALQYFDAQGRSLGTEVSEPQNGTAGWHWLRLEATAPAGATSARAQLILRGKGLLVTDTFVLVERENW